METTARSVIFRGMQEGRMNRRISEDEMVGWHHQLNGHGFE